MGIDDSGGIRLLIDASVTAFSVLGGITVTISGFAAAKTVPRGQTPRVTAERLNRGVGTGFILGALPALATLIIVLLG